MFDSWAGNLAPADYDIFAGPYQKKIVDTVKARHADILTLTLTLTLTPNLPRHPLGHARRPPEVLSRAPSPPCPHPAQARYPDTPFIMYIAKSAALLERMAATGRQG